MGDEYFIVDFDDSKRIMHLAYNGIVHLKTKKQLDDLFTLFGFICDRYISGGKFYLIVDMSNLVIEQDLTCVYAKNAKAIIEKYIAPGGVARYGHQITRLTVRRAYSEYLADKPQIFASREEAFAQINKIMKQNSEKSSLFNPAV